MDPLSKDRLSAKREMHPQSLANLRPYVKGQSGNPAGRAVKSKLLRKLEQRIAKRDVVDAIVDAMIANASNPRGMAPVLERREILDRLDGKVTQQIDMQIDAKISLESVLDARKKSGKVIEIDSDADAA